MCVAVFLEELLARRRDSGAAAVYATHDAEEALGLADRVALLAAGRVVQVGTPEEVYDRACRPVGGPADRSRVCARALRTGPSASCGPEWARLGRRSHGRVREVWFRGPHSDYLSRPRGAGC